MYENAISIKELHPMYEVTVKRATQAFLDGHRLILGLSGKDSGALSICVVKGLEEAMKIAPEKVAGLHVVTTSTTIDNIVIHQYIMSLHRDLDNYAKDMGLPLYTHELKPSLLSSPMVELIGAGKLASTPENTANAGRRCAISWKLNPLERFMASLKKKYQTTKLLNVSGSRTSESNARKANLEKRNESPEQVVKTSIGWSQSMIMDWSLNDVWQLFNLVDLGDIESYSDNFDVMRKHYATANSGTCDLFAGDTNKNKKECGSRFGCFICMNSGPTDKSLEAQISTDEKTYGFMQPLVELRTFMLNTLYDFNNRSLLGRKVNNGFIKVGVHHYSIEYRMNLLRYVLTIQTEAFEKYGYHVIDLIDYDTLLAIQYHWSRSSEPEPGTALKIWHEVVNEGKSFPIPATQYHEKKTIPAPKYFPLTDYIERANVVGLNDDALDGKFSHIARCYYRQGERHRVVRYQEETSFKVVTENGLAMDFVEDYYPMLIQEGKLENSDPTVMLKMMLESGVIRLTKGSIAKIDQDAKRSQTLKLIEVCSGVNHEKAITSLSVSEKIKNFFVTEYSNKQVAEPQLALL